MSRKLWAIFVVLILSFFVCQPETQARWEKKKYKHADKNKDGIVDKKERVMEKKWERKQKSKVNAWWESRADTNNDGKVDAVELSNWNKLKKTRI